MPHDPERNANARPPNDWVARRFTALEGPLVRYVRRLLQGNDEVARDVVQEAFVKLCQQAWPEIESNATAWLYKTCRHQAIDFSRREGRMNAIQSQTEVSELHDRSRNRPDDHASDGEQVNRIRAEMNELPTRQQEILRLRLQDGLSYKQIAEVTGLTVSNVGFLLHQAVNKLRGKVQPQ